MKNETKFNKRPYAKNELVASYDTLKNFQIRGQNIQFKEFSTEIVTLSIKQLHECGSDPYSNLKRNDLKQLKYFRM